MEIIREYKNNFVIKDEIAVAMGYFDGIHVGHQAILQATKKDGYKRGVLSFNNPPLSFITHSDAPSRLVPEEDKMKLLEEMGIDYVFSFDFDDEMMNLSCDEFIRELLHKNNIKHVVVGFNFRFGKGAVGTTDNIDDYCKKYDITTQIISPISIENEVVSSSLIRKCLHQGQIQEANKYLSRNFYLKGTVIKGKQLARTLKFPTANFEIPGDMVIPKWGVYETKCYIDGEVHKSITNVGDNPTIKGDDARVETHILDFDRFIYGEEIKVEFVRRLRGEIAFSGLDKLQKQILSDIEDVRCSKW